MTRRARELETLLLAAFAALPLYFTHAIAPLPLLLFHAMIAGIGLRVWRGLGPELIPARLMRVVAIAYVPFYIVDAWLISRSAIAASTHLVLFIAVYQPVEGMHRRNQPQRLLTAWLIFVASLATSTHIAIVLFVVAFAVLMFRQLMYVSHLETVQSTERAYSEPPSFRAAAFYVAGAALIGAILFPLLPRVRDPFVQGVTGTLAGAASALDDTIDFSQPRGGPADSGLVARVWMGHAARPFFSPIRLRGRIYDRYQNGEWRQTLRGLREVPLQSGTYFLGRAEGVERDAIVQQRPQRGNLVLPVGTYAISGLSAQLYEGPAPETYFTYHDGAVNLTVRMAYAVEPRRLTRVTPLEYPVTPAVAALARAIVGDEQRVERRAALIEQYMVRNFRYIANPGEITGAMSVEDFLLRQRAGHCEYFAAGMAVLLTAVDVPARVAGGYYGGRLNPLTGYYTIRRSDAHAWTEVWNGTRWVTYDSTPPSLRPGNVAANPLRDYLSAVTDSLTFLWDRYVLTFGIADQVTLLSDLMTWARETVASLRSRVAADAREIATDRFAALAGLVVALALAVFLFLRRRRPLFDELARYLRSRGIEVGPAMTLEEALDELWVRDPDAAREVAPLVAMYEEERFSPRHDRKRAAVIVRKLAALRTQ